VSQLVAKELEMALQEANNASDDSVTSYLKKQGDECVKLARVPDTGRVEVVKLSSMEA
jgi:hypothetical protein